MGITTQLNTESTPINVPKGGTGVSTFTTANGVLCSNTTATGPVVKADPATAGFVLTSNGASAIPSFQASGGGTSSGSAKFWAKIAGAGTSINASFNVTSITDGGPGNLTITIATDFSSADWACEANVLRGSPGSTFIFSQAAGTVQVLNYNGVPAAADPTSYYVCGFGDQ